ncbi:MAG: protein-tyrosine-phosphatase [Bacteroidetes bacterium]|nr:protein-tyrosine-phosphatase [Bacteroidota bacterium]
MSVTSYVSQILEKEDTISAQRKEQLEEIAKYIGEKAKSNSPINLTFICTHNSRRSHLSQIWAQAAAVYYNVPNVNCFSGGTEATAFNHRSVKALQIAGFEIKQLDETKNPKYKVYFDADKNYIEGFSKKFSDKNNPQDDFAAIMTCSHADQVCPLVPGATARFAIPYLDPKVADNTPNEENKYNERCKQIATEMFYLFSKVEV